MTLYDLLENRNCTSDPDARFLVELTWLGDTDTERSYVVYCVDGLWQARHYELRNLCGPYLASVTENVINIDITGWDAMSIDRLERVA